MARITLFIFFAFAIAFKADAQAVDVVTGLNNPSRMLISGTDLYFTDANSILKFDVTDSNPVPEVIISGLASPTGIAKSGNFLYVAEFNGSRISKIDITNPVREDFVTGLNTPNFLLIDGDFLYYSDNNSNIVARFDITSANPTAETVAQSAVNFNPTGLAKQGNILYMAQGIANRITSVDVNSGVIEPVNVVTGTSRPLGINIQGGSLFIAEFTGNLISEFTLDGNPPTLTDIVTGLTSPRDLGFSNGTLFIIEGGSANKISKVEGVLGTQDVSQEEILFYPNPASEMIKVKGISEPLNYAVYSVLGEKVLSGSLEPAGEIDIAVLKTGTYFIQLQDKTTVRFIKK